MNWGFVQFILIVFATCAPAMILVKGVERWKIPSQLELYERFAVPSDADRRRQIWMIVGTLIGLLIFTAVLSLISFLVALYVRRDFDTFIWYPTLSWAVYVIVSIAAAFAGGFVLHHVVVRRIVWKAAWKERTGYELRKLREDPVFATFFNVFDPAKAVLGMSFTISVLLIVVAACVLPAHYDVISQDGFVEGGATIFHPTAVSSWEDAEKFYVVQYKEFSNRGQVERTLAPFPVVVFKDGSTWVGDYTNDRNVPFSQVVNLVADKIGKSPVVVDNKSLIAELND